MKVAIIGCGNLGEALAKGMLEDGLISASELYLTRRHTEALNEFKEKGVQVGNDNRAAVRNSELVILSLKPYNIEHILKEIRPELNADSHTLVSVATGISIAEIQAIVGSEFPVYRAMPNTAAGIGESVTTLCGDTANTERFAQVKAVFDSVGLAIPVEENLMEAATILGACGIAYVMRFMRAMVQGGIQIGFDSETASAIVNQAVKGASGLLIENKSHPEHEIDKVTTPKGCTIVGLNEMEHNGFSSSLIKGIVKSFEKID